MHISIFILIVLNLNQTKRPQSGPSTCGSLCTNKGRYCMTDPDLDTKSGVSGADVVRESLRQKCVWITYGGENAPLKKQVR